MYFGPGVEATNKTEFWHGTLWQESPLFGCEKILLRSSKELILLLLTNQFYQYFNIYFYYYSVIYFTGDFVQYNTGFTGSTVKIGRILAFVMDENRNVKAKIQQILRDQELPRNFQHDNHNLNQLWMTENVIIITPSRILSKVSVWLEDTEEPFLYEYKISKILYSFNNCYKTRPISLRH